MSAYATGPGFTATDLVIRLVFPTLWSPRRTILVRFGGVEEKSAVAGVDGASIGGVQSWLMPKPYTTMIKQGNWLAKYLLKTSGCESRSR